MAEEIELKFLISDYHKVFHRILSIGEHEKTAYELTVMYDNDKKTLYKEDSRLRLRKIIDLKDDRESCELSYKKPKTREGIKIEEEIEVETSSFKDSEEILARLGYRSVSSYERIRDTFRVNTCKVTLDNFPFGYILEIEGDEENIKNVAKRLNFNLKDNTTKSCDDIYAEICKTNHKEAKKDILFEGLSLQNLKRQHKTQS
jgi:predicted adenylyl cyclase CyaB